MLSVSGLLHLTGNESSSFESDIWLAYWIMAMSNLCLIKSGTMGGTVTGHNT